MEFLDRAGNVILVNALWLVCCLPVITFIPSCTAMYYAITKSVRHQTGYPVKEFFKSFKSNLLRGIPASLLVLLAAGLIYSNLKYGLGLESRRGLVIICTNVAAAIFMTGFILYLPAALSRFSLALMKVCRLSFVMAFKHLPTTVMIFLSYSVCGIVIAAAAKTAVDEPDVSSASFFLLALVLILPGAVTYLMVKPFERILHEYMPAPKEGEEMWYDEKLD
jgi:uncharacterized membrane protein YesL